MTDRRSKTSRANLGDHVPEALDPAGSVVLAVRLSPKTIAAINAYVEEYGGPRSAVVRSAIERAFPANDAPEKGDDDG